MLNLEWYRTFKVIYEAGSLSAAAQILFISQPGVSLHLSSLESYTGYRLFDRDTRKMMATETGTMLYNFIIDHMNKLEEAEQIFHRRSKIVKPTVSVGMGFELFQHILEPYVSSLPFNLVTRFGECPQMLQELNNGALDLILTQQKGNQNNLAYTPFSTEQMVLVCGSQTDTAALDRLVLMNDLAAVKKWLAVQTWYTKDADTAYLKRFWEANFDARPKFRSNYVLPYYGSILRCLSNGKGFALVPDFLCMKYIANHAVKLAWEGSSAVENTLYFGKRKTSVYADEIKQLEDILSRNRPSLTQQITHQYLI